MAPDAKIDLVEASTNTCSDLWRRRFISAAITLDASVVSMSCGASLEGGGLGSYEPYLDSQSFNAGPRGQSERHVPGVDRRLMVRALARAGRPFRRTSSESAVPMLSVAEPRPTTPTLARSDGRSIPDEWAAAAASARCITQPGYQTRTGSTSAGKRTIPDISSNAGTTRLPFTIPTISARHALGRRRWGRASRRPPGPALSPSPTRDVPRSTVNRPWADLPRLCPLSTRLQTTANATPPTSTTSPRTTTVTRPGRATTW